MTDDAGLSWAIGRGKADFVGKRSLERAAMKSAHRKQLVGLRTMNPGTVLEEGAQLVATAGLRPPMKSIGHITSSYFSAALGHSIALAMVAGGRARQGDTLHVPMPEGDIAVQVTSPSSTIRKGEGFMAECANKPRVLGPAARFIFQGDFERERSQATRSAFPCRKPRAAPIGQIAGPRCGWVPTSICSSVRQLTRKALH